MTPLKRTIALALFTFVSAYAQAAPAAPVTYEEPKSGAVLSVRKRDSRILIQVRDRGRLDLPNQVEFSFIGPDGKAVQVNATALPADARSPDSRLYLESTGSVPKSLDSYIGVSIQLPLGRTPIPTFLRKGK